jgi:polyphosphate kinase
MKKKTIVRDISWLSFNARVLQEAADTNIPLRERIKFLGIFSNNMDEFFRVRVATLKRMKELTGKKSKTKLSMYVEDSPDQILADIQSVVLEQQTAFQQIWGNITHTMQQEKIFLVTEKQLAKDQRLYVQRYFEEEVRPHIIPLMIESIPQFPYLRDKSIFLAVLMSGKATTIQQQYAIIEIPTKALGRFVRLPSVNAEEKFIILLEDVIRFNLPSIFSYFGYKKFDSWIFKVTRDAEIDIDNDIATSLIQKIEKGLKNRRKGKPVRFVYDKQMDKSLLQYLTRRLDMSFKDNLTPGGRIHNFKHFIDFPDVFAKKGHRKKPFTHPLLLSTRRVTDVVLERDVLLAFPYHSYNAVIDMLREAAMDPAVTVIKVTAYRLASNSKIINALINAVRNGKQVTVVLEVRARFEEEANLEWKEKLEEEGVKVFMGFPHMKVHAKICLIKKKVHHYTTHYGFVSTGNLNEKTATLYGDFCLLTSNRNIMADVNKLFLYLEKPKENEPLLKACKTLIPCPTLLRQELLRMIHKETRLALKGKAASIILKMNSLSDEQLIQALYEAAKAGVSIQLIIRGIFCLFTNNLKFEKPIQAISIIDEYLEHARVFLFHNAGKEKVFISSADWMVRNLDHRIEATCPIFDEDIKKLLKTILTIQLNDNVKARILNNQLNNDYVRTTGKKIRSQIEIYNYLYSKLKPITEPAATETKEEMLL